MKRGIIIAIISLTIIAIIFSIIQHFFSNKKEKKIVFSVFAGFSSAVSNIAIGLIVLLIPSLLFVNLITPAPEDIMPAFIYYGKYNDYSTADLEDIPEGLVEQYIAECTKRAETQGDISAYFDRAFWYFKTHNMDLAKDDYEVCFNADKSNWIYAYDLGVAYGWMLDYESSVRYIRLATELDVPAEDRGTIMDNLTMMETYFGKWLYSIFQ